MSRHSRQRDNSIRSSRLRPSSSAKENSFRRRAAGDPGAEGIDFLHYDPVARSRSFDGGYDDLPLSIQRALQVDRSFYVDAACQTPSGTPKIAWVASPGGKYKVGANTYRGEKLIELALTICMTCPVQWECATAALDADERAGIWGDTLENLSWLRRKHPADYGKKIGMAQSTGVSVQRSIRLMRTRLT